MEKKFGRLVQDVWSHKTPGKLKFLIVMPMLKSEKISAEDQTRLSVGHSYVIVPSQALMP